MFYDPIKDRLGGFFSRRPPLQRLFYRVLDTFFLRAWHVHDVVRGLFPDRWRRLRILDAGTGFGQYAHFLARTFPHARILGVDVKDDYLANARRFFDKTPYRDRIELAQEDLTDLQVDGPFDFILSVDVMEHIEDDRGVFRHFARVLAPGGYVLIHTPSDLGGSDVTEEGDASFIEEHVRDGYNADELAEKLREAGLDPVERRYTYGPYGSLAWRMLIKTPIRMVGKTTAALALLPFYFVPVLPVAMALHSADLRSRNEAGTGLLMVARKPA